MQSLILPFLIMSVAVGCTASCGHKESKQFELLKDEVVHVDDCHIKMGYTNLEHDPPLVALNNICGRPESDLDLKAWPAGDPKWSSGIRPPLGFTMGVGDCLLLTETVYCVESVDVDKARFKAMFKRSSSDDPRLERIRP